MIEMLNKFEKMNERQFFMIYELTLNALIEIIKETVELFK